MAVQFWAMPILPQVVGTLRHPPIGRAGTARYLCTGMMNHNWLGFSMDMIALSNALEPTCQHSISDFGAWSLKKPPFLQTPYSAFNIFQHHSWDLMNMSPLGVCRIGHFLHEGDATPRGKATPADHLDSKRWGATAVARSPTSSALSVPCQASSGWQSGNLPDLN